MRFLLKKTSLMVLSAVTSLLVTPTQAIVTANTAQSISRTICVYDPLGANGPIYQNFKQLQAQSLQWGVQLELKPQTNERTASEDFKSGACDGAVLTGLLGRQFNNYTGTLDAYGAVPNYDQLKTIFANLSTPAAAKRMVHGNYEIAGILPGGAAYLFVDDRSIDTPKELSGKRFAYLDSDPGLKQLVMKVGASPVNSTINNMYSQFNNGAVDIVFGPAMVYDAMELKKGMSSKGGVVRYPTGQLTIQLVILKSEFPQDFGQKSREFMMQNFDQAKNTIDQYEKAIPAALWIDLPPAVQAEFGEILRQTRINLRKQSIYDGNLLAMMRKVRCTKSPESAECSAADQE